LADRVVAVAGHLYLAIVHRSTRHAMRGMVLGDVDRTWARQHHRTWVEEEEAATLEIAAEQPPR